MINREFSVKASINNCKFYSTITMSIAVGLKLIPFEHQGPNMTSTLWLISISTVPNVEYLTEQFGVSNSVASLPTMLDHTAHRTNIRHIIFLVPILRPAHKMEC